MGSSPSADLLAAFRAAADSSGRMPFDRFADLALYHPELGYYRRSRRRVGREPGTDFATASSSPLFGRLVAAAAAALLSHAEAHAFVELGPEDAEGVLGSAAGPFAEARAIRLGQPWEIPGRAVVFSNELFDAQPFRRLVRRTGSWRELGVAIQDGRLVEADLGPAELTGPLEALRLEEREHPEGYLIDAPTGSFALASTLAGLPWKGLFLAFDYGKSWDEIARETPAGTARAYHRHQQSNDLLARPGEQDLTCHVCWDWIGSALSSAGFSPPTLESQESFFVHHAGDLLKELISSADLKTKASLSELLHPGHMGQKFQVMWALRS